MCIGAFTSAAFTKATMDTFTNAGLRFFVALIIGAVCAGIFGFLIGIPVLRLKGDYLAIVTLAPLMIIFPPGSIPRDIWSFMEKWIPLLSIPT